MCCCIFLTGCESEEFFGTTGEYILALGADVFHTGKTGAAGGDEMTEPAGNEETARFDDINVKEVEKAPEEEKANYSFAGPVNAGVTQASSAPNKIATKNSAAKAAAQKTVVFLSCGHGPKGNNKLEFPDETYYADFASNLFNETFIGNGVSTAANQTQFTKSLYKVLTNKNASTIGTEFTKEFASVMKKYGIAAKSGIDWKTTTAGLSKAAFYKKYGKKIDRLVSKINVFYRESGLKGTKKIVNDKFKYWQAQDNNISGKYFKVAAQAGTSYQGFPEYQANYETMAAIRDALVADGYAVKCSRNSKSSSKLVNGESVTNKNMALQANESNAIIHICIHWDSSAGHSKGIHTYYSKSLGSERAASKKAAKAMASAKSSDDYTTLNWSTVPTVILECGYMTSSDYGADCYDSDDSSRAKKMRTWAKANIKDIEKGIKSLSE